jgi:RimJ/RimL family protein N-acetyltransferase
MKWMMALLVTVGCVWGNAENVWKGQPYLGDVRVNISAAEELYVQIETEDLYIRSVQWEDYSDLVALFCDPEGVQKYREGIPVSEEETLRVLREWIWRWEEGADPYSACAIFKKREDPIEREFVGYILLGHGAHRGEAELEFAIERSHWNLGFAKQAITAVLQHHATFLSELNYYVNLNADGVLAAPLQLVHAVSRADNLFASRAMESVGMVRVDEEIIHGTYLYHYSISIDELKWLEGQKCAEELDGDEDDDDDD